ncbi:MAG: UDP-N-acetylmuramoyl-L-alanyl-D-glutamate--2,6-diaminopimelate ligase [Oscillospiraceae bacterium]|nr:UDP-N-acetylmuramoyl-L-alanyl-D-glutamate--2,6-diaminopimelate ligase [Oscillospiraceae bacterium]
MRLSELFLEHKLLNPQTEVTGICDNSKLFKKGNVFVCIKGEKFDSHCLAAEMLQDGAAAVVVERDLGLENQLIVEDSRSFLSVLAKRFYGAPTQRLKLIAVTGTNGKSTVAALVQFILNDLGFKCGSIGTIGYDVCKTVYKAEFTTPGAVELYRLFKEMADNGAQYCVIETSSQGLAQRRFAYETAACGIFTNLTPEHLDVHGNMENYFKAKKLLFDMCESAVVCVDDEYGRRLFNSIKNEKKEPVVGYSVDDVADYFAINIKSAGDSASYWLSSACFEKSFPLKLKMPGKFNIANSMAAIAAVCALGIKINDAVESIQKCEGVSGRSEVIYRAHFTVIRDYAHTADALEKFLKSVRASAKGRVLCLFGAAGERDDTKRPSMGEVAAELADYLVVTSDNPRDEDQQKIIDDVVKGIKEHSVPYETYIDRHEAIIAILKQAKENDIVVLCGKGHETEQVIGKESIPFDEKEIVTNNVQCTIDN